MEQIVVALKPFFDAINVKFAAIDGKFAAIDGKFAEVNSRFDILSAHIDRRFDAVERDLYATKTAVTRISKDVSALKDDMDETRRRSADHAEALLEHDKRLRRLEERQS